MTILDSELQAKLESAGVTFDEDDHATHDDMTTDPYGELRWSCGSGDDFICFDYLMLPGGYIALHAVVNSETGSFIQDYDYAITSWTKQISVQSAMRKVMMSEAQAEAMRMVKSAQGWCFDNQVRFDRRCSEKFIAEIKRQISQGYKARKEARRSQIGCRVPSGQ